MTNTKSVLNETPRTIRVSFKTYRDLSQLGTFGDSFDSIIAGLLSNDDESVRKDAGLLNGLEYPNPERKKSIGRRAIIAR
jgi:hypothetical protein